jgi:3-phosphoshikimate 1-carboxyvinyltransferase
MAWAAGGFPVKRAELFMGNSGTAARSLAACSRSPTALRVKGVPRMHERPDRRPGRGAAPVGRADRLPRHAGFPPLAISPRARGDVATVRVRGEVSSQFVSALLMALGWTGEASHVEIEGELASRPYVDLTVGMMKRFGVDISGDGLVYDIPAGTGYAAPGTFHVEGDASSASYFLAAGALGGGPVRVQGVGSASAQGDVAFVKVLEALGARIEMGEDWIECSGRPPLKAFDLDMSAIPDAAMTAAVLALFTEGGPCTLRNIASWRVKETDRIAAMATELRKFGARVQEGADFPAHLPAAGLSHAPASRVAPVSIDTYDDHRMAMCFSLAAFGPRPVRINDPAACAKTFPTTSTSSRSSCPSHGRRLRTCPVIASTARRLRARAPCRARGRGPRVPLPRQRRALPLVALAAREAGATWTTRRR